MYNDRGPREEHEVTCADCGTQTTVPFKPTGARPVLCKDCFRKGKPERGPRGPRSGGQEFEVTCGECGVETTVPFEPKGDRPVLCRDCFSKNRPPRREGGFGGSDRPREMHQTNCTRCGASTEVPFKPTPGRDVLCRDCFRR